MVKDMPFSFTTFPLNPQPTSKRTSPFSSKKPGSFDINTPSSTRLVAPAWPVDDKEEGAHRKKCGSVGISSSETFGYRDNNVC